MEINKDIIEAKVCPYCDSIPILTDSKVIYGKSYGMIYLCEKCNAYVGVHKGTERPLGRLADKDLREAKKDAHRLFDKLWNKAMKQGRTKHEARNAGYKWLSEQLDIPIEYTHIGMFDVETCNKVIKLCKKH